MFYYNISVDANFKANNLTYYSTYPLSYGDLVVVPLGKRAVSGIVVSDLLSLKEVGNDDTNFKIKEINKKIENFSLPSSLLRLFEWMSQYYHYSVGQLVFDLLPSSLISFDEEKTKYKAIRGDNKTLPFSLNLKQTEIYERIKRNKFEEFSKHYLHGITGSGKTAIYISLIKDQIEKLKSVLYLIPEINLSPQTLSFFQSYLNCPIYVYHSGISQKNKAAIWKKLENETGPFLVIGTRSSSFLPLKKLSLIIVDEEHDQSYKQDDHCPYNARDVLIKRAEIENIPILMGSATPSGECYQIFFLNNEKSENNFSYKLNERIAGSSLPKISIVNSSNVNKEFWPFSQVSMSKIREKIENSPSEQVIVFINRLGYSSYLQCKSCGQSFECNSCSTKLKYFKKKKILECQYCHFKLKVPEKCPKCHCLDMLPIGFGTEKIVNILEGLFPNISVTRFDRELVKNSKMVEESLANFSQGKSRILVGTQMISKGHNFQNVNLVVVLGIDSLLNLPDFRNNEKIFQMVNQVAGRSGRFGGSGEVIIDTLNDEGEIFKYIKNGAIDEFYQKELQLRSETLFPPYAKMAIFYAMGKSENELASYNDYLMGLFNYINTKKGFNLLINGPITSYIEKKKDYFTHYFVIRSKSNRTFHLFMKLVNENIKVNHKIQIKIDIDPYQIY